MNVLFDPLQEHFFYALFGDPDQNIAPHTFTLVFTPDPRPWLGPAYPLIQERPFLQPDGDLKRGPRAETPEPFPVESAEDEHRPPSVKVELVKVETPEPFPVESAEDKHRPLSVKVESVKVESGKDKHPAEWSRVEDETIFFNFMTFFRAYSARRWGRYKIVFGNVGGPIFFSVLLGVHFFKFFIFVVSYFSLFWRKMLFFGRRLEGILSILHKTKTVVYFLVLQSVSNFSFSSWFRFKFWESLCVGWPGFKIVENIFSVNCV